MSKIDDELIEKLLVDVELGRPLTDTQYFLLKDIVAEYRLHKSKLEVNQKALDDLVEMTQMKLKKQS